MGFVRQLRALITKNLIIKQRQWKHTIWEFIVPIILGLILSIIQGNGQQQTDQRVQILTIAILVPTAFSLTARFILMQMVIDKETKMRETLKIMSMRTGAYGLSYFLTQVIFTIFTAIVLTVVFTIKNFVQSGDAFTLFIILMLQGVSMLFMSMTLTTVFSDSKLSVQMGSLILSLPFILFVCLYNIDPLNPWRVYFCYFLPHFPSTVLIANLLSNVPILNVPVAWVTLVIISPGYYALYWYMDQIVPDTYGISKSCCFCLRNRSKEYRDIKSNIQDAGIPTDDSEVVAHPLIQQNNVAPIVLTNLTKNFGGFTAVDKLSLSINQGEVFCLLGHNGAGKTTVIQLITGILNPSGGTASIYGHNLQQDIDGVRQSIGLCQQFDVLFEDLTVREHLKIVCELKNIDPTLMNGQIDDIIEIVMLREHENKTSKTLSGGMKRKLSLAMALVGDSRLIILDEPTSGLDVESRRQVWALIKKIKVNRSIIMSTQHLEEADELSDRICIMSHGRLLALDTSFNIKKQFGVGYNLQIEPNCDLGTFAQLKDGLDLLILRDCGIQGCEESTDSTNKKYMYLIPFTQQAKIPSLLKILEDKFPQVYFDLEMNSLEDAYVNIARAEEKLHYERNPQLLIDKQNAANDENNPEFQRYLSIQSEPKFFPQVKGMIVRRLQQFKRETRMWILLISPFVTIVLSFLLIDGLLPKNDDLTDEQKKFLTLFTSNLFVTFVLLGFSLCSGLFILAPVADKENKLRHLLNFIGMKPLAYYTGSYLTDLVFFMVPTLGFIILLFPLNVKYFIINGTWALLLASMTTFGLSMISLTYLLSFMYVNANNAFKYSGVIFLLIGLFIPGIIGGILGAVSDQGVPFKIFRYLFTLDPFWNFSDSMNYMMVMNFIEDAKFDPQDKQDFIDLFDSLIIVKPTLGMVMNIISAVLFFIASVIIDTKRMNMFRVNDTNQIRWQPRYLDPDVDVLGEAQRIERGQDQLTVKVRNIQKTYKTGQPAVGGVSFGIGKNEVVGLLGPNGAGKSTTFSMLTMEMPKTNGEIQIMNTQIENFECLEQGKFIGLAAQSNVIWDTLTVDEHLEFIGKVKGLNNDDIEFQKDFIKRTLDLTPFGDKLASQLSGGNKRKLCSAVSLMSNPTVEFLDEPTTGVDPIARRSLFKMLKQLKNSSILLTTHRMDEAESLCDKIAIMINGKFVCYGSPSHLKQKYGQGYEIIVKPAPMVQYQAMDSYILGQLPFCKREISIDAQSDSNAELIYKIEGHRRENVDPNMKLSKIFEVMNDLKDRVKIVQEYQVTRSSLEHVFIHFAKFQLGTGAAVLPQQVAPIAQAAQTQQIQYVQQQPQPNQYPQQQQIIQTPTQD